MDPETLAAHAKGVKALAQRLLRDDAAADDVVQDACVAALSQDPDAPTRPWLVRVVRNLSFKQMRTEVRRKRRERLAAQREAMPPASEVVERAETHRMLVNAVLALEEPYRSTLLMHYFDGKSAAEIARQLERPVATVRTHLNRGVLRLRKRFGAKGLALLVPLIGLSRPASAATLGVIAMSTTKKTTLLVTLVLLAITTAVFVADPFSSDDSTPRREADRAAMNGAGEGEPDKAEPARKPDRDLDLHGVVVDQNNEPVAGAKVMTLWDPWKRAFIGDPGKPRRDVFGPESVSDTRGRFALRLRRGQRVDLRVTAEGFATKALGYLQAGERVRVVMTRGVTLVIEIVDDAGKPAPGTQLWLSRDDRQGADRIDREGVTDANGRCRFSGLPAGQWAGLNGRHPVLGTVPWQISLAFPVQGERVERIRIPAGRVLRGAVIDDETGKPIEGARLSGAWIIRRFIETDKLGRFAFYGWGSNKEFAINVVAAGYLRAHKRVALEDDLGIRLKRGWTVTGRLLNSVGKPLGVGPISAWGRSADTRLSFGEATSSADGRFEIGPLTPGTIHTLIVAPPGHGKTLVDFGPPEEGTTTDVGDIVVPAARLIGGRVLRPDGSPAIGVLVELTDGNTDRDRLGVETPRSVGAGSTERRRTDDLGRFRFNDLAPGQYAVHAKPSGMKALQHNVELPADRDATGIELTLVGGHELLVRVRDQHGDPVPTVYVNVTAVDKWSYSQRTDAEGNARFTGDTAFKQVGRVYAGNQPFLPPPPQAVPPGATEMTIEVRRAQWAEGTVYDTDGRPIPQANFTVLHNGKTPDLGDPWGSNQGWTSVAGHFRILVPDGVVATIELTGGINPGWTEGRKYPPLAGRLDGIQPGSRGLELHAKLLAFDRSLTVRVLDPDGKPLPGAQVFAYYMGKLVSNSNKLANADGYAQLDGLPAHKAVIYAKAIGAPESWMKTSLFVLAEGQEVEMKIRVGVKVSVIVTRKGKPAPSAWVAIIGTAGTTQKQGRADELGRFTCFVDPTTQGPFTVRASLFEGTKRFDAKLMNYALGADPVQLELKAAETR